MKWYTGILITLLALAFSPVVNAAASEQTAIVWLMDVSGSMTEVDPQRVWMESVLLGLDLAPSGTQTAFLTVSDVINAQSPLTDATDPDGRAVVKEISRDAEISGYTNFGAGLSAALDILSGSAAKDKYVFFIGDFVEAGFKNYNDSYGDVPDELSELTGRLIAADVKTHLLFFREPKENQSFIPLWEHLSARTGGSITYITSPADLSRAVGNLYLENFDYNMSLTTGVNSGGSAQDIPIRLPGFTINRARLYLSSEAPLSGLKAYADGALTAFEQGLNHAYMELTPPFPPSVTLTLPPESRETRIYLIADSETLLNAAVDSVADHAEDTGVEYYRQKTAVILNPTVNGSPLFPTEPTVDTVWQVIVTGPGGEIADASVYWKDQALLFDFYPDSFGTYRFDLSVRSQGISLSASTETWVDQIELPPIEPPRPEPDYSLLIAITAGLLMIILSALLAIRKRRKERRASVRILVPLESAPYSPSVEASGVLRGKLDIYGIIVDGGKTELPATALRFDEYGKLKSVTLAEVLAQAGVPYRYPAANNIRLVSGPDHTLIVENNSDAAIYRGAQAFHKGQKTTLIYGQKMRAVFEADVSEYEVYYHNAVNMAVSGSRVYMEHADQGSVD